MSDAAITSIVTGLVTIGLSAIGFLTLWIKLKYGVQKVEDANTKIDAAAVQVQANTDLTTKTKDMAETVNRKLNGGLDNAVHVIITGAVGSLRDELLQKIDANTTIIESHMIDDEHNMAEIREALVKLTRHLS